MLLFTQSLTASSVAGTVLCDLCALCYLILIITLETTISPFYRQGKRQGGSTKPARVIQLEVAEPEFLLPLSALVPTLWTTTLHYFLQCRELAALGVWVAQNCVARLPITIIISSAHRRCRQVPSCCCCGEGPGADASLVASTAFGSIFQALGGSFILILEPRFIRPSLWVTGFSLECRLQSLTSFLKYGTSSWESGRHLFFL